ncbi:Diacetylchitobiose uptake system permease protein NgcG [Thermoflexales bacterium]|nr:Diacetylchitobiose uptake system permease protein NgcG [Thermoflexales bacterium]
MALQTLNPSARSLRRSRVLKDFLKSTAVTFLAAAILIAFLLPFAYMLFSSLKTKEQMSELGTPLWPADASTFTYKDAEYDVYRVPTEQGLRDLALFKKGLTASTFIDPANPEAEPIRWTGSWRALPRSNWKLAPHWENFMTAWKQINFPRMFGNTLFYAVMTLIGMLFSCTLVAYGFARFRIPGKDILFTILLATVFLPATVTVIPTYTFFTKIGWVGTWLPLIVPTFFANAFDVFLLRQFFLTIPREMDEAAMLDGAGPLKILTSIILPQAMPALIAVSVFHIVWAWNDFFGPFIYLTNRPELQPISVGLQKFNSIHNTNPNLTQATSLLALLAPLLLYFVAQRVFVRGIVITGVEK